MWLAHGKNNSTFQTGMSRDDERALLTGGHKVELRDICHSAATRREHHRHRAALVVTSHDTLARRALRHPLR